MKYQLYAIFDTASGVYQKSHFGPSDGEAKRVFSDAANDPDHPIGNTRKTIHSSASQSSTTTLAK